jgi:WD40 repeat protein
MPSILIPNDAISTGPGKLWRGAFGTLPPAAISQTVTNKALTSNVATLTFSTNTIPVGATIVVSGVDTTFDGVYKVTAQTGTTASYARTTANVTSAAASGTVIQPGGTVAGSVFTDALLAAWIPVGATAEGSEFSYNLDTDQIVVAEYLDPLQIVSTGRQGAVAFDAAQDHLNTWKMSLNGGTISTVSGTGATLLSQFEPPAVGQETRTALFWESDDNTIRKWYPKTFQSGSLSVARRKGADYARFSDSFALEQPASGQPFYVWTAGVTRVGA